MTTVDLYCGDCLEVMPTLEAQSVDAIITDLPYGTTACAWDVVIPFAPMWEQVRRLLKPRGAFVTTASQPFTSALVMSNPEWFKYAWVWDKVQVTDFLNANNRPLRQHEDVVVFSENGHTYNPQYGKAGLPFGKPSEGLTDVWGAFEGKRRLGVGYPRTIIRFQRPNNLTGGGLHPTQKPVALYEYLIRTYTAPGDMVLDIAMGSGAAGVACVNTGRSFIGIDISPKYVELTRQRTEAAQQQIPLFGIETA